MPLWKNTDTNLDGAKPVHLKDSEKKDTYATKSGWVHRMGGQYTDMHGNVRKKEEILVSIRDLANTIGAATITSVAFNQASGNTGFAASVIVNYNENVDVFRTPTLTVAVANTTAAVVPATVTATYAGVGNNSNELRFGFTTYSNAAIYTLSASGVTIANTGALEIVDSTANTVAADLTIPGLYTGANSTIGTLTTS